MVDPFRHWDNDPFKVEIWNYEGATYDGVHTINTPQDYPYTKTQVFFYKFKHRKDAEEFKKHWTDLGEEVSLAPGSLNLTIKKPIREASMRIDEIITSLLKEARISKKVKVDLSSLESWVAGRKFVNLETNKPTTYDKLPEGQKEKIKKQYEQEKTERDKDLEEAKKKLKEKYKEKRHPESKDYVWTYDNLKKLIKQWGKSSKQDLGENYEGAVHDLAESFLFSYPGASEFLKKQGPWLQDEAHRIEWIANVFPK